MSARSPLAGQFVDIGSGLPTNQNVHEVAQLASRDVRVVYVDIDPVVVAHAQALLSGRQTAGRRPRPAWRQGLRATPA